LHFKAGHSRHADISNKASDLVLPPGMEKILGMLKNACVQAGFLKQSLQCAPYRLIVIYNCNLRLHILTRHTRERNPKRATPQLCFGITGRHGQRRVIHQRILSSHIQLKLFRTSPVETNAIEGRSRSGSCRPKQPKLFRHSDQVGEGFGLHLTHHLPTVNLGGDFLNAEFRRNLLVAQA
jgi:hypothetical protein